MSNTSITKTTCPLTTLNMMLSTPISTSTTASLPEVFNIFCISGGDVFFETALSRQRQMCIRDRDNRINQFVCNQNSRKYNSEKHYNCRYFDFFFHKTHPHEGLSYQPISSLIFDSARAGSALPLLFFITFPTSDLIAFSLPFL